MTPVNKLRRRRSGRPPNKRESIVAQLRGRIVGGELQPGSRLPNQVTLERQFRASNITIQQAMNVLARQGFIQTMGPRGTFVHHEPPHLCHYGMVFPDELAVDGRLSSRFYDLLENEFRVMGRQSGKRRVTTYHGVTGLPHEGDYLAALEDLKSRRFAGLIFGALTHSLRQTPLVREPGVPRVAIQSEFVDRIPSVYPDLDAFLEMALDRLAQRGRKRVALISLGHFHGRIYCANFEKLCAQRGLITRSYWTQFLPLGSSHFPRCAAELLLHPNQSERPDALIISDDHLVQGATEGAAAMGVRGTRDDVEIIAHCNFPNPTPAVLPVTRLGFDARHVMRACIDSIDMQRRGEIPPDMTAIKPVFGDEGDGQSMPPQNEETAPTKSHLLPRERK